MDKKVQKQWNGSGEQEHRWLWKLWPSDSTHHAITRVFARIFKTHTTNFYAILASLWWSFFCVGACLHLYIFKIPSEVGFKSKKKSMKNENCCWRYILALLFVSSSYFYFFFTFGKWKDIKEETGESINKAKTFMTQYHKPKIY